MRVLMLLCSMALLFATACGGQPQTVAPTVTPAFIPSPTPEPGTPAPTATPRARATLPPTWTPAAEAATATPTFFTPQVDLTQQALLLTPTLPVCAEFGEDRARNTGTFVAGEPATVYWTAVRGATAYEVRLLDRNLQPLATATVTGTSYTFRGETLQPFTPYGWDVRPYNANNAPLCASIGGALLPF